MLCPQIRDSDALRPGTLRPFWSVTSPRHSQPIHRLYRSPGRQAGRTTQYEQLASRHRFTGWFSFQGQLHTLTSYFPLSSRFGSPSQLENPRKVPRAVASCQVPWVASVYECSPRYVPPKIPTASVAHGCGYSRWAFSSCQPTNPTRALHGHRHCQFASATDHRFQYLLVAHTASIPTLREGNDLAYPVDNACLTRQRARGGFLSWSPPATGETHRLRMAKVIARTGQVVEARRRVAATPRRKWTQQQFRAPYYIHGPFISRNANSRDDSAGAYEVCVKDLLCRAEPYYRQKGFNRERNTASMWGEPHLGGSPLKKPHRLVDLSYKR